MPKLCDLPVLLHQFQLILIVLYLINGGLQSDLPFFNDHVHLPFVLHQQLQSSHVCVHILIKAAHHRVPFIWTQRGRNVCGGQFWHNTLSGNYACALRWGDRLVRLISRFFISTWRS